MVDAGNSRVSLTESVNELACGEGGRASARSLVGLAVLAGVAYLGGSRGVPVLVPVRASPVPSLVRGSFVVKFFCKMLFATL